MRSLALTLVFLAVVLVGCSEDQNPLSNNTSGEQPTTTLQKPALPFQGSATGMSTTHQSPTCVWPYTLEQSASGTGDFSHMGHCTATATYCVGWYWTPGVSPLPWSGPVIGTGTIKAANGDEVYFSTTSTYTVPNAMPLMNYSTGTYTITGGTGRFAGATGTGTLTGVQELAQFGTQHVTTFTVNGTIVY
ncbi:MAG: hypothetical protein M5R41_01855 [Bacteroidia bacterium]|nr:hypothetical protein [Bacteroidia bacterium]